MFSNQPSRTQWSNNFPFPPTFLQTARIIDKDWTSAYTLGDRRRVEWGERIPVRIYWRGEKGASLCPSTGLGCSQSRGPFYVRKRSHRELSKDWGGMKQKNRQWRARGSGCLPHRSLSWTGALLEEGRANPLPLSGGSASHTHAPPSPRVLPFAHSFLMAPQWATVLVLPPEFQGTKGFYNGDSNDRLLGNWKWIQRYTSLDSLFNSYKGQGCGICFVLLKRGGICF